MPPKKKQRHKSSSPSVKAADSSPPAFDDAHTPKRLKAMDPDVTVVVGGVKFYHYKAFLCSSCDFFDTALAADMREKENSVIEFPDKNPDEWLEVYSFLEQLSVTNCDLLILKGRITAENAMKLITWFDFLGLKVLAEHCDLVICDEINKAFRRFSSAFNDSLDSLTAFWEKCRSAPCPKLKECIVSNMENWPYLCDEPWPQPLTKQLLLDDEYGDRFWPKFRDHVGLPSACDQMDRVALVNNPLFGYLVASCMSALDRGVDIDWEFGAGFHD
jgi:hypothetical protein